MSYADQLQQMAGALGRTDRPPVMARGIVRERPTRLVDQPSDPGTADMPSSREIVSRADQPMGQPSMMEMLQMIARLYRARR